MIVRNGIVRIDLEALFEQGDAFEIVFSQLKSYLSGLSTMEVGGSND